MNRMLPLLFLFTGAGVAACSAVSASDEGGSQELSPRQALNDAVANLPQGWDTPIDSYRIETPETQASTLIVSSAEMRLGDCFGRAQSMTDPSYGISTNQIMVQCYYEAAGPEPIGTFTFLEGDLKSFQLD